MTQILDGKKVRDMLAANMQSELAVLGTKPKLAIIQVGADERSTAYVEQKKRFGAKIGVTVDHIQYAASIAESELCAQIQKLNTDKAVNGIIVQLPLPSHINKTVVIESIDPAKDVDGLHSTNAKLLEENQDDGFIPATAKGILSLLDFYHISLSGKKVTVIGRSVLVGHPVALACAHRGAVVTVCHKGTEHIPEKSKQADILISAAGVPKLVTKDFVREGQIVIDVGITKVGHTIAGDVDFDEVAPLVSAITPVPGGVGPMTVVSLFQNLLIAYKRQTGLE